MMVCLKFWADILSTQIYTHCQDLMKSVGGTESSSIAIGDDVDGLTLCEQLS
jgi:hypothetical protein